MLDSQPPSLDVIESACSRLMSADDSHTTPEQYAQTLFCFAAGSIHMFEARRQHEQAHPGSLTVMLGVGMAQLQGFYATRDPEEVSRTWPDFQAHFMGVIGCFAHLVRAFYPNHRLVVPAPWGSSSSTMAPPVPFWSSELRHGHSWSRWLQRYVIELCTPATFTQHSWTMIYEYGLRMESVRAADRDIRFTVVNPKNSDGEHFYLGSGPFLSTRNGQVATMYCEVYRRDGTICLLKKYGNERFSPWTFKGIITPFGICGTYTWVPARLRQNGHRRGRGYFWLCKQECSEPAWPLSQRLQCSMSAWEMMDMVVAQRENSWSD